MLLMFSMWMLRWWQRQNWTCRINVRNQRRIHFSHETFVTYYFRMHLMCDWKLVKFTFNLIEHFSWLNCASIMWMLPLYIGLHGIYSKALPICQAFSIVDSHFTGKKNQHYRNSHDSIRLDLILIASACVCAFESIPELFIKLYGIFEIDEAQNSNWRIGTQSLDIEHWTLCIRADKLATQRQHELIHKGNYIVYRFVCVFVVSYLLCFLRPFPSQPCANICWILFNATFMCQICIPKMHKPKCNLHTVHSTAWWS